MKPCDDAFIRGSLQIFQPKFEKFFNFQNFAVPICHLIKMTSSQAKQIIAPNSSGTSRNPTFYM